jgi:two-component system, LytTR family, response regulator
MGHIDINGKMYLPTFKGVKAIDVKNIIRIEAISNYSKLYFADGNTLVVAKVLRWFEAVLDTPNFLRIHRTHLVNKDFIEQYTHTQQAQVRLLNGELLHVSKRRKARFLQSWHGGTGATILPALLS